MPLREVPDMTVIKPESVEKYDLMKALRRKVPPQTFDRLVKTVDEALDATVTEGQGKLVWTKMGALFGHFSHQPKVHVEHLWTKIIEAVGDGKECLMLVGSLLRWRIALRPEDWLLAIQNTGENDPDTGRPITVSEYWIHKPRGSANTEED